MVGEFVCCSFCGDAAALVERFVEDAHSFEGLAVCAGGCARALGLLVLICGYRCRCRCIE